MACEINGVCKANLCEYAGMRINAWAAPVLSTPKFWGGLDAAIGVVGHLHLTPVKPSSRCCLLELLFQLFAEGRSASVDESPSVTTPRIVAATVSHEPVRVGLGSDDIPIILAVHPGVLAKMCWHGLVGVEKALFRHLLQSRAVVHCYLVPDGEVDSVWSNPPVAGHLTVVGVELVAEPSYNVPAPLHHRNVEVGHHRCRWRGYARLGARPVAMHLGRAVLAEHAFDEAVELLVVVLRMGVEATQGALR